MSVKVASIRSICPRNMVVETLTLSTTVSILGRRSLIIEWASSAVGKTLVLTSSASDSTFALVFRMAKYMPKRTPACRSTAIAVTAMKSIKRPFMFTPYAALNILVISVASGRFLSISLASSIYCGAKLFLLRVVHLAAAGRQALCLGSRFARPFFQILASLFSLGHQDFARLVPGLWRVQKTYYSPNSDTSKEPKKPMSVTFRHNQPPTNGNRRMVAPALPNYNSVTLV